MVRQIKQQVSTYSYDLTQITKTRALSIYTFVLSRGSTHITKMHQNSKDQRAYCMTESSNRLKISLIFCFENLIYLDI